MLFLVIEVNAQDRTIVGKVTASEDGNGLPGVTVAAKGNTTIGTVTDGEGKYSLSVPANVTTLSFSYIGMLTQEVAIDSRSTIDVSLVADTKQLTEVVVTAVGVERSQKALGFATSTVKSIDIVQGRSFSPMNALQGKVAGVVISSASGAPGASTNIFIRGASSIGGNNNPLYVIDGVPMNNSFSSYTSDANIVNRSQDFGNRANDVNPDDIETITILKSASATALYGSRAANGVILITTKKGKSGELKVNYSGSATFTRPLRIPELQEEFGQGWNALADLTQNGSWGPKFDGRNRIWGNVVDNSQQLKPYVALPSNVKDFYSTGTSFMNTLSLSGGTDKVTYYASYGNTAEDGVVPTNADSYKRNTLSFRGAYNGKKLSVSTSINYVKKDAKAVTTGQGNNGATLYQELIQIPSDISIVDLKDYNNKFNNLDNFYTPYNQNPYFVINENGNNYVDNRVYGNVNLGYKFTDWLSATWRLGSDVSNNVLHDWVAIANFNGPNSTEIDVPGTVFERTRYDREFNSDLILTFNKDLSHKLHLNAFVGHNINQRGFTSQDTYVSNLSVPGFYNLSNSGNPPTATTTQNLRRLYGVYGQAELALNNYLFLTVLARNDWSSTLPKNKNSYFYPGANLSFVFSDAFPGVRNIFSYGKVRASVGQTGRDADPYLITSVYEPASAYLPFGEVKFPLKGVNAYEVSDVLGNPVLKPELTTEYEFGTELKFLQSRIGIDFTYYNKTTKDLILSVQLPASSGYLTQVRNFGKVQNKGIELRVDLMPIRTDNFTWTLISNWTINRNKVLELTEGIDEYVITNAYDVDFVAKKGKPLGVYKVPKYLTDNAGHVVVNAQGIPVAASDKEEIGDSQNKFVTGLTNQFWYKGISLSFTIDYRDGGKMYSYSKRLYEFVGNSTNTLYNDRQPFVVPNSVKQSGTDDKGEAVYVENDIPVTLNNVTEYFNSATNTPLQRGHVIDRTYFKLREIVLGYDLPKSVLGNSFIRSLNVSLVGRNLFLWTPASNNIVDPEATTYTGGSRNLRSLFGEFAVGPTVGSAGISVRAGF